MTLSYPTLKVTIQGIAANQVRLSVCNASSPLQKRMFAAVQDNSLILATLERSETHNQHELVYRWFRSNYPKMSGL